MAHNDLKSEGSFNAQAAEGGHASVSVYQLPPLQVDPDRARKAHSLFETMPLDRVPTPAPLAAGSHMPLRDNPLFVGREADLKALALTLKGGGKAAIGQVAAATGLGGIGKTQLASAFVHRYGQYFAGGVFWIGFAEPESIPAEIASAGLQGRPADLPPDFADRSVEEQVRLMASLWRSDLPCLLVFDNCEDPKLLKTWCSPTGHSRVLLTTRCDRWDPALGVTRLPLETLPRAESIALMRKYRPNLAAGDPHLDRIADMLGDLPLALQMAGNFLHTYTDERIGTPEGYLEQLQRGDLLDHISLSKDEQSPTTGHDLHVARTFAISYERLDPQDDLDSTALALLARAACFAPGEPIPRNLLQGSMGALVEGAGADLCMADAIHRLENLGLIEWGSEGLRLHRLLAAYVARKNEPNEAARTAVEENVLDEARHLNLEGFPAPLLAWQPHLRHVADEAERCGSDFAGGLLNELGVHLWKTGDYPGARQRFERALEIDETALGPEHPNVAVCLNNLGTLLQELGDLGGARKHLERALEIGEIDLGPDHPAVATRLSNLGIVLQELGDLEGARKHQERALEIDETALGPEHPYVANCLSNLGMVLKDLGDLPGAKRNLERALEITESALGPNHPDMANRANNLGTTSEALGDLSGAKKHYEHALDICERSLGSDHPHTRLVRKNLKSLDEDG